MESAAPLESASGPKPARASSPSLPGRPLEDLVTIERGATCLERDRLIERIARWLQRTSVEAPLRVHVRGDRELPTRVFFSVVREPGDAAERRLDNAPSECDQLHSAVALSIALAIEATLQRAPAADGVLREQPAKPAWKRKPPPDPLHVDFALLGGASVGVLTGPALAGAPRLTLSPWSWLEIAIAGFATHLAGETFERAPGRYATTVFAGGLDLCFGGGTSPGVAFFMCVGGRGGTFRSEGDFNLRSDEVTDAWWALAASGQGRFWLAGSIGIGTSVEAMYALRPRTLVVEGQGGAPNVHKPVPQLGLNVAIGPVFRFF